MIGLEEVFVVFEKRLVEKRFYAAFEKAAQNFYYKIGLGNTPFYSLCLLKFYAFSLRKKSAEPLAPPRILFLKRSAIPDANFLL